MATGGIFTIITNDGKQDRMLMATALLHERLRTINNFKMSSQGGKADDLQNLPTLLDIEKTHVLFTNAHFKPFAAIGFEYNKVRATSGNPTLGQSIQFSIPQFGDFFHDICCHATLQQPTLTPTATLDSDQPLMRWCDFPGERLLKRVQQEVNGNPLDEYTFHATNFHREFRVAPNKRLGWDRCVGQEVPERGFVRQPVWDANGIAPASVTSRVVSNVCVGNQTPTGQKDQTTAGNLELFIPLLFWYNKDVRLAVPSVAIPYGQRFINVDLASRDELVDVYPRGDSTWAAPGGSLVESSPTLRSIELYINNLFMNPEVHKIYIKRIGFSLIRVHRQQLYNALSSSAEVLLQQLKWPIEYLFVGMKIKNYYASSSAADKSENLDKWQTFHHVTQETYTTQGQEVFQEADLLPSTGTLTITQATGVISGGGTGNTLVAVPQFGQIRVNGAIFSVSVAIPAGTAMAAIAALVSVAQPVTALTITAATPANVKVLTMQGMQIVTQRPTKTVDLMSIKAHGVNIYDAFPSSFFNAYTSYHFGGPNINTPDDVGAMLVPFCLFPGTYQPSGHINISRAREFYLNYESSVIGDADYGSPEGTLVVIASAINFLLISDGSAVLRYST